MLLNKLNCLINACCVVEFESGKQTKYLIVPDECDEPREVIVKMLDAFELRPPASLMVAIGMTGVDPGNPRSYYYDLLDKDIWDRDEDDEDVDGDDDENDDDAIMAR